MNTPLYISRKLSLASTGGRSTPAVKVAVTAVAISIAVMIASVAVVLGFKNEIRDKIIGFNSHITLYTLPGENSDPVINLDPSLSSLLDSQDFITSYNLELSMPAIFKTPDNFKGIYIKGKAPGADYSLIENSLIAGRMPDYESDDSLDEILISKIAANQLGLSADDKIDTYFITDDVRVRKLKVAGVYDTHFENYDDVFVFGNIRLLQELSGLKSNQGTAIKVQTNDFEQVNANTSRLHNMLIEAYGTGKVSQPFCIENVNIQGANYFQWLDLLDTNVWVILILMMAVGCITLISGLLILIIDKTRFIGIVRSLGLSNSRLSKVFTYLSLRVAVRGMVIGNVVVATLLLTQYYTHFIKLDAEAYYFDYVPVALNWQAFLLLDAGALAVIFITLLLPSRFVARISPAVAMRYE